MSVTKNIKARQEYQIWTNADMSIGDILGFEETLGHPARTLVIEPTGGPVIIRVNVCKKIYHNQESLGNKAYFGADAAFFKSAQLVDEIEEERPEITIESGSAYSWEGIPVRDIKIIVLAPTTRITVR